MWCNLEPLLFSNLPEKPVHLNRVPVDSNFVQLLLDDLYSLDHAPSDLHLVVTAVRHHLLLSDEGFKLLWVNKDTLVSKDLRNSVVSEASDLFDVSLSIGILVCPWTWRINLQSESELFCRSKPVFPCRYNDLGTSGKWNWWSPEAPKHRSSRLWECYWTCHRTWLRS